MKDELGRIIALDEKKKELQAQLKEVNEERREVERAILHHFESTGISRVSMDGVTVHLSRRISAKPKDGDTYRITKIFMDHGMLDMLRVHSNTLSSMAREHMEDAEGGTLPPELWDALEVDEIYQVRTRKG